MEVENDFLANVKQEGSLEQSDESVNDNIEDSPTETNNDTESPPQEGDQTDNTLDEDKLPFHKHPRWQEKQRELEELRNSQAKLMEELETIKAQPKPQFGQPDDVKLPESWVIRYGDSDDSKKAYAKYKSEELPTIKDEIIKEIKAEQDKVKKQEEGFVKWVDDQVQKVASVNDVDFKKNESLKNEFLDFMNKRRPTDAQGNIDFINGWQWFSEIKEAHSSDKTLKQEQKKKLANMTGADTKPEQSKDKTMSAKELRYRGWTDLY